jgi:hypothetical protein
MDQAIALSSGRTSQPATPAASLATLHARTDVSSHKGRHHHHLRPWSCAYLARPTRVLCPVATSPTNSTRGPRPPQQNPRCHAPWHLALTTRSHPSSRQIPMFQPSTAVQSSSPSDPARRPPPAGWSPPWSRRSRSQTGPSTHTLAPTELRFCACLACRCGRSLA